MRGDGAGQLARKLLSLHLVVAGGTPYPAQSLCESIIEHLSCCFHNLALRPAGQLPGKILSHAAVVAGTSQMLRVGIWAGVLKLCHLINV